MQPLKAERRDPAPSRTAYRIQRLWLTPLFRLLLRVGLPVLVVLGPMFWYVTDEARVDDLRSRIGDLRASIEQRPEFMVNLMRIENASDEVAEDIREVTAIDFPVSSFDLDLTEMRLRIEELDAVARAELVVRSGGVLEVTVRERIPAIVWRARDALELLDGDGHRVSALDSRARRADLPLIAGEGADRAVPEALELFAAAGPVAGRLRGLLRIGERRWDLVLDRDQRIMLPEVEPVAALERLLALDAMSELLRRDVAAVDLRDARRPILRLGPQAIEFLNAVVRPGDGDDT
ncbi:MAG: cell division protein FtsQ/DivIB [Rhodobacteraceae bacterium]|nr:cell division protein FtsQ/DivIB [Paracoccaceae bacterium]